MEPERYNSQVPGNGFSAVPVRICLALCLCMSLPALAQQDEASPFGPLVVQPGAMPDPSQGILRLDVVVTDQTGSPVPGLAAADFTLLDNDRPQPIVSFHAFEGTRSQPDPPVEVILVIDELDLPPVQLEAAERQVQSFLLQNEGRLSQPVCIYRVDKWGLFASPHPSRDGHFLADEIANKKQLRTVWGSSMFGIPSWNRGGDHSSDHVFLDPAWNEMPHSLVSLGAIAIEERRKPGRKLMFWIGPGWRLNRSHGKGLFDFVTELSTRLREARIDLWSITAWPQYDSQGQPSVGTSAAYQDFLPAVKSEKDVAFGNLSLQVIATQTGGGVIETSTDVAPLIAQRVSDANMFYSFTFDPQRTTAVDEYHELQVKVKKSGLTAHTRSGYYDEPVFYDQPPFTEGVTVQNLEQILNQDQNKSDAEAARQLNGLELTECLSSSKLAMWQAALKGKRTREALIALADQAVFLPPPAAEVPPSPPPGIAAQQQMILRTLDYMKNTIPRLPDFFANRETAQYNQLPRKSGETWKVAPIDQSLHLSETLKSKVLFRGGKEISEGKRSWGKSLQPGERALDTVGTFGPILRVVLAAATGHGSELAWSRWEQHPNGRRAVFHYKVPEAAASFLVGFCCLPVDYKQVPFEKKASVHGEFAIDPDTGAILRLTVEADLEPRLPLDYSGIMVEYAPVDIGGIKYICPVRSVSLARQRTVTEVHEWGEAFKVFAPYETVANDVSFSNYHRFRSSMRIVPDFTPVPAPPR